MNKKIIGVIIILLTIVGVYFIINNKEVELYATLDNSFLTIENGTTTNIKVDTNIENPTIKYMSNNEEIVTIDDNGLITARRIGSTVIYVSIVAENFNKILNCNISVIKNNNAVQVNNISVPEGSIVLNKGSKYTVPLSIEPSNAIIDSISYISGDTNILKVNKDNSIEALSTGNCILKILVNSKVLTIDVYVIDNSIESNFYVLPTTLQYKDREISIKEEESYNLELIYNPSNINMDLLTYEYDNTIISLNNNTITGLKVGSTTLKVKGLNNVVDEINITIKTKDILVSKLNLSSRETITINEGETSNIKISVEPSNATDKTLTYTSMNTKICTVDKNGKVTGVKRGITTVKVTSSNNIEKVVKVIINKGYENNNSGVLNAISCSTSDTTCLYKEGLHKFTTSNGLYYLVYIPNGMSKNDKKVVHLFMHGSGEGGHNYNSLVKYGLGKLICDGNNYDFIIILAQRKDSTCWDESEAKLFVESFKSIYNNNTDKVTVGGYSCGSFGTVRAIKKFPSIFSKGLSIAPCSSLGYAEQTTFKNNPIKIYVGKSDTCSTTAQSICALAGRLQNAYCEILSGESHNNRIVTKIYAKSDIIDFISS